MARSSVCGGGGGGGGFLLACKDYEGRLDQSFPACFFESEDQLARTNFTLGQDQSTGAQRAETTVDKRSWRVVCELISLIGSHSMPRQHSQPFSNTLGESIGVFRCNLPPALFAE